MPKVKNKISGVEDELSAKDIRALKANPVLSGAYYFPKDVVADPPELTAKKAKKEAEKKAKEPENEAK